MSATGNTLDEKLLESSTILNPKEMFAAGAVLNTHEISEISEEVDVDETNAETLSRSEMQRQLEKAENPFP
jgi:hypothetical protein